MSTFLYNVHFHTDGAAKTSILPVWGSIFRPPIHQLGFLVSLPIIRKNGNSKIELHYILKTAVYAKQRNTCRIRSIFIRRGHLFGSPWLQMCLHGTTRLQTSQSPVGSVCRHLHSNSSQTTDISSLTGLLWTLIIQGSRRGHPLVSSESAAAGSRGGRRG